MAPAGGVPTENLIGYRPNVERLVPEGLNMLQRIEFPNDNNMASRLRWSPELVQRVSGTLSRLANRFKVHVGKIVPKTNPAPFGWIQVARRKPAFHLLKRETMSPR